MNYEILRKSIKGPVFSVITPFKENEDIDYGTLNNYLDYIYRGGARIFYVMGYNSRYSELSHGEIKELNLFVTEKVKTLNANNIVIVADPLHCSTKTSIEFAKHAKSIGADVISLIFREKYYFEDQVLQHYQRIAESTDFPFLIHEMPFISGKGGHLVNWPISLLNRLADIENIIAIKEDAKEDQYTEKVIDVLKDRLAIVISGGGKRQWLRFAEAGCQAWLNGIGVFEPRLATLFYKYHQEGNITKCQEIIDKIEIPFFEQGVAKYGWHLTIKSTLETLGIMQRKERMPLLELPDDKHRDIVSLINSLPLSEILRE